jgi:hypothetical protein
MTGRLSLFAVAVRLPALPDRPAPEAWRIDPDVLAFTATAFVAGERFDAAVAERAVVPFADPPARATCRRSEEGGVLRVELLATAPGLICGGATGVEFDGGAEFVGCAFPGIGVLPTCAAICTRVSPSRSLMRTRPGAPVPATGRDGFLPETVALPDEVPRVPATCRSVWAEVRVSATLAELQPLMKIPVPRQSSPAPATQETFHRRPVDPII